MYYSVTITNMQDLVIMSYSNMIHPTQNNTSKKQVQANSLLTPYKWMHFKVKDAKIMIYKKEVLK